MFWYGEDLPEALSKHIIIHMPVDVLTGLSMLLQTGLGTCAAWTLRWSASC